MVLLFPQSECRHENHLQGTASQQHMAITPVNVGTGAQHHSQLLALLPTFGQSNLNVKCTRTKQCLYAFTVEPNQRVHS